MLVNKTKASLAREMVRKVTPEGEKVDPQAVRETYIMLGGLVREEEVEKPKKKKIAKKIIKEVTKEKNGRNNKSTKKSK